MEFRDKNRADSLANTGMILIALSIFLIFIGALPANNPAITCLGIFLCIIGIFMTIAGIAMGGTIEWSEETKRFRTHPNIPTITAKEKEIIVKEVVMIPCSYCGGLMPQTAIYCPHCGARRKS